MLFRSRPVSAALLRSARIATRLIQSRRGLAYGLFGAMLRMQDKFPALHQRIERRLTSQLSALAIRYGDIGDVMQQGDRFPAFAADAWPLHGDERSMDWISSTQLRLILAVRDPAPFTRALAQSPLASEVHCVNLHGIEAKGGHKPLSAVVPHANGTAWLQRPDGYLIARLDSPSAEEVIRCFERYLSGGGALALNAERA